MTDFLKGIPLAQLLSRVFPLCNKISPHLKTVHPVFLYQALFHSVSLSLSISLRLTLSHPNSVYLSVSHFIPLWTVCKVAVELTMAMTETMALETLHEVIRLVMAISQPVTFVEIWPFISLHLTLTEVKMLDNTTPKGYMCILGGFGHKC